MSGPETTTPEEMAEELSQAQPNEGFHAILWLGVLAGPIVVLADLQVSYMLVPELCGAEHRWLIFVPTVVALALVVVAMGLCWRERHRTHLLPTRRSQQRAQFLAALGLALGAFSVLALVAMAVPKLILGPCDP
jgi:hypothetical protein